MNSINPVGMSFGGNYYIPISEVKDENTLNNFVQESRSFVKNIKESNNKDGVVITVDNARDKEYEAIIAKYGMGIHRVDNSGNTI